MGAAKTFFVFVKTEKSPQSYKKMRGKIRRNYLLLFDNLNTQWS